MAAFLFIKYGSLIHNNIEMGFFFVGGGRIVQGSGWKWNACKTVPSKVKGSFNHKKGRKDVVVLIIEVL